MKIKFITMKHNLVDGGGSNICLDLKARVFQQLGHEVSVITLSPKGNKFKEPPPYQIIEEHIKKSNEKYNLILAEKRIYGIIKKFAPETDIFYSDGCAGFLGAGLYRKFFGKKPVVFFLNGYCRLTEDFYKKPPLFKKNKSFKHKLRIALERTFEVWLMNSIDKFFCTSQIAEFFQKAGLPKDKFMTMPDFIDVIELKKHPKGSYPFHAPSDKFHILYTGALDYRKGVDLLIRAFSELEEKERCHLHLVGGVRLGGDEKNDLEKLAENLNLSDLVTFYPWISRDKLLDFYQYSDLFVHPARWPEPFGLTIVEAMAFGVPVVVPVDGCPSKTVGKSGLIFKNGDVKDLKEKMSILINKRELRQEFSEKGRIRAEEFDYRNYIGQVEEILINLTKR